MSDIADGESVEVQGSGSKPYVLKNVGGVYSCSCPAWRNQSSAIERRTCKHLRKYRGDAAEEARIGGAIPAKAAGGSEGQAAEEKLGPPVLLAESWDNALDLSGWWMSEKLDGVRAWWDGKQFLSRQGNQYHAPDWFLEGLPNVPLDGELWIDRKAFQRTVSVVRRQDKSDHWKSVRYLVFDAPTSGGPFEDRMSFLRDVVHSWKNAFVTIHQHDLCRDLVHLQDELRRVESLGGEGLMLRQPGSKYASGRSSTLLKVKTFHDAEAVVIGHEPGKGRHQGRLGALTVRLADGKTFSVGTGFSDKQREQPPPIGTLISFRYQELSDRGIPRFPSYVGIRTDVVVPKSISSGEHDASSQNVELRSRTERPAPTVVTSPIAIAQNPNSVSFVFTGICNGQPGNEPGIHPPSGGSQARNEAEIHPLSGGSQARNEPAGRGDAGETEGKKSSVIDTTATPQGKSTESGPTLPGSRYFEFIEGKSSKFWEIGTVGNQLTTRWGRIGSKGQSKTKKFSSADAAWAERNAAIESKLASGYREIAAGPPSEAPKSDQTDEVPDEVHDDTLQSVGVEDPVERPAPPAATFAQLANEILASPPAAIRQLSSAGGDSLQESASTLETPESELAVRPVDLKKPMSFVDIEALAYRMAKDARSCGLDKSVLGAIERWTKKNSLTNRARQYLRKARDRARAGYFSRDVDRQKGRIDVLVGDDAVRNPIQPKEVWATAAIDDIKGMPPDQQTNWIRLLQHCITATSGKPSESWTEQAKSLIAAVTRAELLEFAGKWLPLVDKPRPDPAEQGYLAGDPLFITEGNQDILRGLVWCCSMEPDGRMARVLGSLGISAYRKIRVIGARAVRVGNACVYGLGVMADADAVAQLAILKVKVKFGSAQRYIEAELNKAAERLNLPREELEEMSVPAYGLDDVGIRRETLGDFTAELSVNASGKSELRWLKADGSTQKSVPAAVQTEFSDELKELKTAGKDIDKMLPIQRERIDGLFLAGKHWPLAIWRDRYLDHPLVGTIARRLIWWFRVGDSAVAGIFWNGELVDSEDRPLTSIGDHTTVELWHPLSRPLEEVAAWRNWLERHEVQQPFKQAHREVYVLTDAERSTNIYSNRFAAHVLRQSQFRALASSRGWQTRLLGYWDGGDSASAVRPLPQWNIVAEFWLLGLPPDPNDAGDTDLQSAGMPLISTDQVRFSRADDSAPLALADVPLLVFSEVMRDVDLFVGVASVGNDPGWVDGGPNGHHADYWHRYSFGNLSATARTRFEVLERLLPRLKIASRCSLDDRFLVVRGDMRTYKIHLGSSNILMSPNDEYLCIVPKPVGKEGPGGGIFLPFEGDRTLSIILSKAFLLAEDTKIDDPTITRQIARTS